MVTLSREQAAALLKAAERRPLVRVLVTLGVATGARLGELLALRWQDVDLRQRQFGSAGRGGSSSGGCN